MLEKQPVWCLALNRNSMVENYYEMIMEEEEKEDKRRKRRRDGKGGRGKRNCLFIYCNIFTSECQFCLIPPYVSQHPFRNDCCMDRQMNEWMDRRRHGWMDRRRRVGVWEGRKGIWTDEWKQISLEETERALPEG